MVRLSVALAATVLLGSLIGGCGSSSETKRDAALLDVRGDLASGDFATGPDSIDAPTVADGPVADAAPGLDAPDSGDPPEGSDGPAVSGDGSNAYIVLPDGRTLTFVDHCRLQPLDTVPSGGGCPASFSEAVSSMTVDAGRYRGAWVGRCSEGVWFWVESLVGGFACYYRPDTQGLFAAELTTDTPTSCGSGDLVSFVPLVYGETVRCTNWVFLNPDGGTGPSPQPADASDISGEAGQATPRDATKVHTASVTATQVFMQPTAPFLLQADLTRATDGRFVVSAKVLVSLSGCSGDACNRQLAVTLSKEDTARVESWLAVIPGQACQDDPGPICDFAVHYAVGIDGPAQNQTCCKRNEWGQNANVTGLHDFLQSLAVAQLNPLDGGTG